MGIASATFALSAHQQTFAQTIQQQDFDFRVRPYLQDLQGDRVTVMIHINRKGFTWLEVRAQGEQQFRKVVQSEDGLIKPIPSVRNPARLKAYKVVYGKEISSPLYTFKTPDENSQATSCVILMMFHEEHYPMDQVAWILPVRPEFDFATSDGDMFDYVTNEEDLYDKLLTPLGERFASEKPFFMLRGQHVLRDISQRDCLLAGMLDTGEDKPDTAEVYAGVVDFDQYRIDQAKWAENNGFQMQFRKSAFRVVVMDIPPFYSGGWHRTMRVPLFICALILI
ncbi:hypothetical protein FQR65_LT18025 [Abscondita terminalis]|nr:hypothetical protein FQR65_LT18025 [Abscondita terminalis]